MSGGHFCDNSYPYYKVAQFADELEQEIAANNTVNEYGDKYNFDPDVIDYLEAQVPKIRKMAEIMRAVDYLYSGDHGEDSFMSNVKNVEKNWVEVEALATRWDEWNETGDGV